MKILLTGGGTGGHLYPLLVVAEQIKIMLQGDVSFLYLGPVNEFSKKILQKNNIKTKGIVTAKWRRYWSLQNFIDIFKFPIGLIQSLFYVLKFMPDVVFSKGGFGSVAPTIVSRLYFIPVLVHESDVVPGKANRFLAKITDKIAVSYPETQRYFKAHKVLFTGNPIRDYIKTGSKEQAVKIFNLNSDRPVILILGGSQGSQEINKSIAAILPQLLKAYQIIHQVGPGNLKTVEALAGKLGIKISRSDYHPYEFLEQEIAHALAACDLVISRAGSNSISEIAASGKPSIVIPLSSSANDHQNYNAYQIARQGAAVIMKEENLTPSLLLAKIEQIMTDPALRQKMGQAIKNYYQPNAAQKIAQGVIYLTKISDLKGQGLFKDPAAK